MSVLRRRRNTEEAAQTAEEGQDPVDRRAVIRVHLRRPAMLALRALQHLRLLAQVRRRWREDLDRRRRRPLSRLGVGGRRRGVLVVLRHDGGGRTE